MAQITPPLQPDAETAVLASGPSPRLSPGSVARDFLTLTKPKIISLLLITAAGGMFMAAEGVPPLLMLAWVWIGGALASGGANAINQHLDRDIDREMSRTRSRPVAGDRVAPKYALAFGVALNVAAFALLATLVNLLAAGLTLTASLFYVFVYTLWLKRTTPNNIVIGGAAGAIPPLVGWAAVTGSLDLPAVYLFAIVFFWTPPHFWALSLLIQTDYGWRAHVAGGCLPCADISARFPLLDCVGGALVNVRFIAAGGLDLLRLGGGAGRSVHLVGLAVVAQRRARPGQSHLSVFAGISGVVVRGRDGGFNLLKREFVCVNLKLTHKVAYAIVTAASEILHIRRLCPAIVSGVHDGAVALFRGRLTCQAPRRPRFSEQNR